MTHSPTVPTLFYPAVQKLAVFDSDGPRPQFLLDSEKFKALVVGLEPGQQIPVHPETMAIYCFLAGEGMMTVGDEHFVVTTGSVVLAPTGAARGIRATSRLTFLATKSQ
jgi:quercetin dioxygenase-like cupin family protein